MKTPLPHDELFGGVYFYDVEIIARYAGRPVSAVHISSLISQTEVWRAAAEDRLDKYAPPLAEAQIAVLMGMAADLALVGGNLTGDQAFLDIRSRLADAGEPIWTRFPRERRAPPTWRPNVSE